MRGTFTVSIYDASGRTVALEETDGGSWTRNAEEMLSGLYSVVVSSAQGAISII